MPQPGVKRKGRIRPGPNFAVFIDLLLHGCAIIWPNTYFMESGLLYNPTMKQTNLRAGCKSALQPGTMTGRRSETFEDLLYLFSSEDKYKGFSLY